MSVITITEYATIAVAQVGGMIAQVPQEPPLVQQAIAITASTVQSAAFNAQTTLVRINIDGTAAAAITFGTNPTATIPSAGAGSQRVSANGTQFHGIPKGQSFKVAFIATT
jgi:hypothetical protein